MMSRILFTLAASAGLVLSAPVALAQPPEQSNAREKMQRGQVLTPRQALDRILPRYPSPKYEYITFEWDSTESAYRFKFYKNKNQVIWVDVDGRTGKTIRVSS